MSKPSESPSLEGRGKGKDSIASQCDGFESLPRLLAATAALRPSREGRRLRRGFTLVEIVLAIALTSVVMYLLTTAIELFMLRMESSRARVESAQIARALLDQIADDLAATRLYSPPSTAGGAGGGDQSGNDQSGSQNNSASGATGSAGIGAASGSASSMLAAADVQGIYGNVEQLRIDRAARPDWRRSARTIEPQEAASTGDMPQSVRYYLVEGDYYTSQRLAQRGVSEEESSASLAGLYRESLPTAALAGQTNPLADSNQQSEGEVELLAPEVVKFELMYFDGSQLVEAWDSYDEAALPAGVEIRLTLYEPPNTELLDAEEQARIAAGRFRENELVEYRRFIRIPTISPQQPAQSLLPPAEGDQSTDGSQTGGNESTGGADAGQGGDQDGGEGTNGDSSN